MSKSKKIPIVSYGGRKSELILESISGARTSMNSSVMGAVAEVIGRVSKEKNRALFDYTKRFDGVMLTSSTIRVTELELDTLAKQVDPKLKKAIREAAKRIRAYHKKQKIETSFTFKTDEGKLSQIVKPLTRVGVYIPGGYTAYPSTVLMNVIPAQIAGVKEIVAVTPPRDGLDPKIAFVLKLLGVNEIYKIGGAQAVAALAYGTESIRPVDKIVGPGNSYVAAAKRMVYGLVDIDSIAGPSEVAILADSSVKPEWVALDILSQAEHGSGDETAICVTEDDQFAKDIKRALVKEIKESPVEKILNKLPDDAITIFVTKSRDESIELINRVAPEHLQIMTESYRDDLKKIKNGSAIFLGRFTPVALGDYFVGTNHVLPTGSAARYASPLGVESFLKRSSVAEISESGLKRSAEYVSVFARAEGFFHHAISVERRVKDE